MRRHHHRGKGSVEAGAILVGLGRGRGHRGPRSGPGEAATGAVKAIYDSLGEGDWIMFDNHRARHGGRSHRRERDAFGFGGGRGRSERTLEQGDLRWLVLDLISIEPRHGYEIIKAIEEMLNGHYTPSPGVIYPTLTFLEETGLISSVAEAAKKLYTLTPEGRAALEANSVAIQAVRNRIDAARQRFGGPPAPELIRAMQNLRAAIQVRLGKGELSPASLATVTAALDRAAGEIERS